jgi:hypothetical protein
VCIYMFPGLNIDPVSLVRWSIRSTFRSLIIHTLFFPFLDSFNKGYFKYQNTSHIYIYIYCEGWIERQKSEVQNKDGVFKFFCELYFYPSYFFAIRWLVLCIFNNCISILNFIFIIFQFLVGERRERKWLESSLKREKYHFFNSGHQNIRFLF